MQKLYLNLYHGRVVDRETFQHPDMNDWGTDGPTFEIESFQWTYGSPKIHVDGDLEHMATFDDLIYYNGVFYGDFNVSNEKYNEVEEYKTELTFLDEYFGEGWVEKYRAQNNEKAK